MYTIRHHLIQLRITTCTTIVLIFRNNESISNFQQTGITNHIIETNTPTTNYIDEGYLNNSKLATVILNPTPSVTENYLWIPETSDNFVPWLYPLITYAQSRYATLTTLHHNITHIDNTIQTELNNLEIPNQGDLNVNYNYFTIITLHILRFNEITQYTNMTIVEHLLYRTSSSRINEKVTKTCNFNY